MLQHRALTERSIGLAIDVHREVGPGLLETVCAAGLCLELNQAGIAFGRQVAIPVIYKGIPIGLGFHADVVVEDAVIFEVKAVPALVSPK
ncbi:GxxExxY protein [Rhodopila sp.]|uniref:GxxExxY protein n=1 Tax=Rhodopila sp. TaxID=2480087 RepID=UPI003D0CE073